MICRTITSLPNIGERIMVQHGDTQTIPATVISMAECKALEPRLFGDRDNVEHDYHPDATIRAYKYDRQHNGYIAGFCIMRFRDEVNPVGPMYNRNILVPVSGEAF